MKKPNRLINVFLRVLDYPTITKFRCIPWTGEAQVHPPSQVQGIDSIRNLHDLVSNTSCYSFVLPTRPWMVSPHFSLPLPWDSTWQQSTFFLTKFIVGQGKIPRLFVVKFFLSFRSIFLSPPPSSRSQPAHGRGGGGEGGGHLPYARARRWVCSGGGGLLADTGSQHQGGCVFLPPFSFCSPTFSLSPAIISSQPCGENSLVPSAHSPSWALAARRT